ncbi:hypothetical protein [Nitrincola schmidtii]|uniref:hypothetical protein n=1 Tax=Nitrincola schmidtii TaxID=1730894 RepID=UPI00124ECD0C|nr:hypothetical protein [Nitrincola schmidtii]
MKPLFFLLAMSLSLPVLASPPSFTPAASNDRGRSANAPANSDQRSAPKAHQQNEDISADYQPIIRRVLEEYFGLSSTEANQTFEQKRIPPGLQKKLARGGDLPPGWQMKLARGDVFPPDLYAKSTRLPNHWAGRGGNTQEEEWLLLEDKIVRVVQGQGTILDVIDISQAILR